MMLFTVAIFAATLSVRVSSRGEDGQAAAPAAQASAGERRYVGSQTCRRCHAATYERWSKTRMANVVTDPHDAAGRDHPGPLEARSARDVQARRHRVRLRQQVEAALLHEGRRRLLPAARSVGRHQPGLAAVLRAAEHRLVGAALSRRQHAAADRSAVRRLPLGELRHQDARPSPNGTSAASDATGRAARTSPRPTATNIVNPAKLDFVRANDTCIQCHSQGSRCSNPIEGRYYDWPVGFDQGEQPQGLLASSRSTSSARRRSRTFPTAPPTRTGCRATTSSRA